MSSSTIVLILYAFNCIVKSLTHTKHTCHSLTPYYIILSQGPQEVTEAQKSFFGKKDEEEGGVTPAQKSFFGKDKAAIKKPKPAAKVPLVAPKTSDAVLKATEVAKDEVKKKGVEETKQKMNSKSTASTPTAIPDPEDPPISDDPEIIQEEKGTKRKLVKGATLIFAAGAVAVARNVVKAWIGRGML